MIEGLLVLGFLLAMVAVWAAWTLVPLDALILAGSVIALAGLLFGVPTGLVYHVLLRRSLLRAGSLPPRWWLRPTSLHERIPALDRRRVRAWCVAGAAGFLLTLLGCAVVALGAVRALQMP